MRRLVFNNVALPFSISAMIMDHSQGNTNIYMLFTVARNVLEKYLPNGHFCTDRSKTVNNMLLIFIIYKLSKRLKIRRHSH